MTDMSKKYLQPIKTKASKIALRTFATTQDNFN